MTYKKALADASSYASYLDVGDTIEKLTDWDTVKEFFEFLPRFLAGRGFGLKQTSPGNYVVYDRRSEMDQSAMKDIYEKHSCPTCSGRGIV